MLYGNRKFAAGFADSSLLPLSARIPASDSKPGALREIEKSSAASRRPVFFLPSSETFPADANRENASSCASRKRLLFSDIRFSNSEPLAAHGLRGRLTARSRPRHWAFTSHYSALTNHRAKGGTANQPCIHVSCTKQKYIPIQGRNVPVHLKFAIYIPLFACSETHHEARRTQALLSRIANYESRFTRVLPETLDRVELLVTYRKQTLVRRSTRDIQCHLLCRRAFGSSHEGVRP